MTHQSGLNVAVEYSPKFAAEAEPAALILVSHYLCPYVQRAAIALDEKGVPFERRYIDLANKPDWFVSLSPLGKVPLLVVVRGDRNAVIFESAVILEYLEDTQPNPLHPADPLERARHRAWIEFGGVILSRIAGFYSAPSEAKLRDEASRIADMFERVEAELGEGPWFAGWRFGLVDAVYGPIFRYFDVFDRVGEFGILSDKPKTADWRRRLAMRHSVRQAVAADYPSRLETFLRARDGALARRIAA